MLRGVAGVAAGAFLLIFGLNMLGLFAPLRRFRLGLPGPLQNWVNREAGGARHRPFVIGLLNGLMIACGPLQAMYVMAAGTGSPVEGAKTLFVFGLGTLPVMLAFGALTTVLSGAVTHRLLTASGVIVVALGAVMINRGLILTGSGADLASLTRSWRSPAPVELAQPQQDSAAPKTQTELKQVAEFFQGREVSGKKVYGAAIFTERGSEGITMGVANALYPFGFQYQDPKKPYTMEGFVNGAGAVAGLEFYKALFKCCTPPGYTNAYMQEGLDAFKSGQVAMQMNWFAFFPGLFKDPNVGGEKIGFFVNPGEGGTKGSQLGGQGISVVSYSPNRNEALQYIKWFASLDVQKKWWALGGYTCHKGVLNDPGFAKTAPFAGDFLVAMGEVKDFWAEPSYAPLLLSMQKRVHDYVVADQGTAKGALDALIADWAKVFKEDGKMK
jgi:hypothetical protein